VSTTPLRTLGIDLHGHVGVTTPARWLLAGAVALAGSLAADALLVRAGVALFPATRGYEHFRFGDYALLTTLGVVAAWIGWPVLLWFATRPTWLLSWAATAVTLVLLVPDVYIAVQGQPIRAVAVLMCMHLAIGVITYASLLLLAPGHRASRVGSLAA
jgi:hypothetical protein